MKLISSADTGLEFDPYIRFAVVPSTGDVVLKGKVSDHQQVSLCFYQVSTVGLIKRRTISLDCLHVEQGILPVTLQGHELLAVSCYTCRIIRLLDFNTWEFTSYQFLVIP